MSILPAKNATISLTRLVTTFGALAFVAFAVGRIHLRSQTTLIGYEIGRLKTQEAQLLEERSHLKMQLAKLTTQKHLMLMTESEDGSKTAKGTFALK